MKPEFVPAHRLLFKQQLLRLTGARGWRISCVRGCLLVTQYNDARDYKLLAGDTLVVTEHRLVLIEAIRDAVVKVEFGDATAISCRVVMGMVRRKPWLYSNSECANILDVVSRITASQNYSVYPHHKEIVMNKNAGTLDRVLRVVVGLGLVVWAAAFGGPVWAWIGLMPLATGALGVCPAYSLFGINTCPLKK